MLCFGLLSAVIVHSAVFASESFSREAQRNKRLCWNELQQVDHRKSAEIKQRVCGKHD